MEDDNEYLIDLLSEWQSVHALLPPYLKDIIHDLNQSTVDLLNRVYRRGH